MLSGIDFLSDVNAHERVTVGRAHRGDRRRQHRARRRALLAALRRRRGRHLLPAHARGDAGLGRGDRGGARGGHRLVELAAPVSIQVEGPALKSLTLLRMELGEPDASGRRQPVPVEGSEYDGRGRHGDLRGRASTRTRSSSPGCPASWTRRATSPPTRDRRTPGGRACSPPATCSTGTDIAIRAIAGGKHAARSVLAHFEGKDHREAEGVPIEKGRPARARGPRTSPTRARAPRANPRWRAAESRRRSYVEIERDAAARAGAGRGRALPRVRVPRREGVPAEGAGRRSTTPWRSASSATSWSTPWTRATPSSPATRPSACCAAGASGSASRCRASACSGTSTAGFTSLVAPSFGVPFGKDPTCISCGQCVSACPVGALTREAARGARTCRSTSAASRASARCAPWAAASSTGGTAACSPASSSAATLRTGASCAARGSSATGS